MDAVQYFQVNPKIAIALSGGVDSAYLLYIASKFAEDVHAYYVQTEFQPEFEGRDARKIAEFCKVSLTVIPLSQLACADICRNDSMRCYYCKRRIFEAIQAAALRDGYTLLADGTNADDLESDRPGFRALRELSVLSPLRDLGLTKDEIRRRSKEVGLFSHDKPAYACLATRIQQGEAITAHKLAITEDAESCLYALGFRDFRIRLSEGVGKLQLRTEQFPLFYAKEVEIMEKLHSLYPKVLPQPEVR